MACQEGPLKPVVQHAFYAVISPLRFVLRPADIAISLFALKLASFLNFNNFQIQKAIHRKQSIWQPGERRL